MQHLARPRRAAAPALAGFLLLVGCTAGPRSPEAASPGTPTSSSATGPSTPAQASSTSSTSSAAAAPQPPAPTGPPAAGPTGAPTGGLRLPRGGTTIFPAHRLVGFSGYPGSPALGRLGIGELEDRVREIEGLGQQYAAGRAPLPVLELIATVVHGTPGADGMYRTRIADAVVQRHLDAAREHRAILLLNIQPGRAAFLDEVKAWERWLREPDVGLALDPEWAVKAGQVPGRVFGSTTGAELNAVAAYVSGIVTTGGLPEKVVLYHQLHASIVRDPAALRPHPGIALVVSVDGIGTPAQKASTWRGIVAQTPDHVHKGLKLFYEEDARPGPLMTPAQVLALTPQPEYVLYE